MGSTPTFGTSGLNPYLGTRAVNLDQPGEDLRYCGWLVLAPLLQNERSCPFDRRQGSPNAPVVIDEAGRRLRDLRRRRPGHVEGACLLVGAAGRRDHTVEIEDTKFTSRTSGDDSPALAGMQPSRIGSSRRPARSRRLAIVVRAAFRKPRHPAHPGGCLRRLTERRLTVAQVEYVLEHGHRINRTGIAFCVLRRRDIPAEDREQARRLENTVVLVNDDDVAITVYRNRNALRDIRRKSVYQRRAGPLAGA